MSAGKGTRWGEGHKHLVKIEDETLLERIVRQTRNYTKDIYITTNTSEYKTRGAKLFYPKNNEHEIDRFLSNRELWKKDTVFLYGDVCYTDEAIKKIFKPIRSNYRYYGRYKESTAGGKDHAELFAIRIKNLNQFERACEEVKKGKHGWGWLTYRYLLGEDPNITATELRQWLKEIKLKNFTEIDDETDDFDRKEDYTNFISRIPKIIHIIWIGGNFTYEKEINSWREQNPNWEVKLWTEKSLPRFKNQRIINKLEVNASKVDLMRLEILYKYGGIYTDADSVCLKPIDELIRGKAFFSATNNHGNICNSFMGARPKNPTIKKAIDDFPRYFKAITKDRVPFVHDLGTKYLTPIFQQDPDFYQIDKGKKMGTREYIAHESEIKPNTYVYQEHKNTWKTQSGGRTIRKITFNYNIMAHEKRRELAEQLAEELNCDIIWDRKNNVWDTRKRCLKHHIKSKKDIGITIQDDCTLAPNFKELAETFIREKYGNYAYNFFYMKGRHAQEELFANQEQGYVKKKFFINEIAFGIPTSVMPEIIEHCKDTDSDSLLARWITKNLTTYYPLPSLADHKQIPSIYYEKTGKDRLAWWFYGNPCEEQKDYTEEEHKHYTIYRNEFFKIRSKDKLTSREVKEIIELSQNNNMRVGIVKYKNNKIKVQIYPAFYRR